MIRSFDLCLRMWMSKAMKFTTSSPVFIQQLKQMLSGQEFNSYPKCFKHFLTWNFSHFQAQDSPQGPSCAEIPITEWLSASQKAHWRTLRSKRNRWNVAMWDLLQCKTSASSVPNSFIKEGYLKHWKQMQSAPTPLPEGLKEKISDFVYEFCEQTAKNISSDVRFPTNHASLSTKRSEGGQKNDLTKSVRFAGYLPIRKERIDPIVIHLEGRPGIGKSYSVKSICRQILARFGNFSKNPYESGLVYSRSAATKHWDGYTGQLITVIDDIGFQKPGVSEITGDSLEEIIQLCSDVDYRVPMASLSDKGRKFTSQFLILTSNLATNHTYGNGFACPAAYNRRLSPTYVANGTKESLSFYQKLYTVSEEGSNIEGIWSLDKSSTLTVSSIVEIALSSYCQKYDFGRSYTIRGTDGQLSLQFPEFTEQPIPEVMTYAVPEPLKVRLITKPDSRSYVLKPLQEAMFKSLQNWSCFEPCWNPDYDLTQLGPREEGRLHLSGDYTAATDELNFFASQAVFETLLASLRKHGHGVIADWAEWESKNHLIHYPEWTGLASVIQENGQLMGSLLSFPVLCMLNAFSICQSSGQTLGEVRALFHGDDVAAYLTAEEIQKWKSTASDIGLQLSVGKNYVSNEFVSIDSQLFCPVDRVWNHCSQWKKQRTGKFRLIKNRADGVLTCASALEMGFTKDQIRCFAPDQLKNTIRSLDVATEYGGLGIEGLPLTDSQKAVYLVELYRKTRVQAQGGDFFSVPKEYARLNRLNFTNAPSAWDVETIDKATPESKLKRSVGRIIEKKFFKYDFSMALPLNLVQRSVVRCVNTNAEEIQRIVDKLYHLKTSVGRSVYGNVGTFGEGWRGPKFCHVGEGLQSQNLNNTRKKNGPLQPFRTKLNIGIQGDLKTKMSIGRPPAA